MTQHEHTPIDDIIESSATEEHQEQYIDLVNEENRRSKYIKWLIISLIILGLIATAIITFTQTSAETHNKVYNTLSSFLTKSFLFYLLVGLFAQMVDGALGMAYGATCTAFLASLGVGPAQSSASIHIAEVFTTGASGISHFRLKNVNKKLFRSLVIPGIIGSITGALILSLLEKGGYVTEDQFQKYFKPFVTFYTLVLGAIVIRKALQKKPVKPQKTKLTPLALVGSFFDAVGGGGWGPIVTSTLLGRGRSVTYTIGSVNASEFFVAFSSSIIFGIFLGLEPGLWQVILGLIIGGVFAAPFAAYLVRKVRRKPLMIFVGSFIIFLSLNTLIKLTFGFDTLKTIAKAIVHSF
ncbi:sulfite exporter TauE/SafE family protein [Ferruginibacter sp. SUN002]|uniref:sulfite exporter TauE/SafE family protein n=1 Tax=Ferruginibacter sp. SUN002 TaxID=2937789 RepID=UPI003D3630B5